MHVGSKGFCLVSLGWGQGAVHSVRRSLCLAGRQERGEGLTGSHKDADGAEGAGGGWGIGGGGG